MFFLQEGWTFQERLSEKKDTYYVSIGFESNLSEMPNNTWWLDSDATTHVSHVLLGFLSIQPIRETEKFLYMGNIIKERVEEHIDWLDLEKCLYVYVCAINLISSRF